MASCVRLLDLDSAVFGIRCGRLELDEQSGEPWRLTEILDTAWRRGMQHLTARVPAEWSTVAAALRSQGFRPVQRSWTLEKAPLAPEWNDATVCVYEGGDDVRLRALTRMSFTERTRFHSEPVFSREGVATLHERWIQALIDDESVCVFIHRAGPLITGYVAIQSDRAERSGHIGLIAVDPEHRGKGIGAQLLRSMQSAMAPSLDRLSVMTEAENRSALRLYAKCGFVKRQSWEVWHAVRERCMSHEPDVEGVHP